MKQILHINLSGRAISIEEPAYEKLQHYIRELRRHFSSEESREEILNDIEGRISELLYEKLQRGSDRITEKELEEVIASIGRPEDFEEATTDGSNTRTQTETPRQKRLYRDAEDKILGGVCSGIASYFGIDSTIVRLLFAIITFGGFGTGFFIYLALWVLLPKKSLRGQSARRLYRNPDDRMLGGVASGLAAYFHAPVRNVRLIFAAPILINILFSLLDLFEGSIFVSIGFGGLTGTFVLAYIILWVILPEAHTQYQKMEMRGEKVDLDRIKQTVKESTERLEERMKSWGAEVEESARNLSEKAKEFSQAGKKRFRILYAIGNVIRFFIYLFLGTIAFAFLVAGVGVLFAGLVTWPAQQFFFTTSAQQWGFWAMIFLFFVVPCVFLIIFIVRRLFRVRRPAPALGWTFGVLWTLGWIALFWTGVSVLRDFEHKVKNETEISIPNAASNTLLIDQSTPPFEYTGTWQWINGDPEGFDITRESFKIPAVRFKVEKSADSLFHVRVVKYAWGRTPERAQERLDKIDYPVASKDSVLDVAPGIVVGKEERYRGQHIELRLQVPAGKSVRFTDAALKHHSWLYQPDSVYTMAADGDLHRSDGKRVRS
jgi:phage shock protein PspC (stress-responsive transcriptional regulator)